MTLLMRQSRQRKGHSVSGVVSMLLHVLLIETASRPFSLSIEKQNLSSDNVKNFHLIIKTNWKINGTETRPTVN